MPMFQPLGFQGGHQHAWGWGTIAMQVVERDVDVVYSPQCLLHLFEAAREFFRGFAEGGREEFAEVPGFAQGDAQTME